MKRDGRKQKHKKTGSKKKKIILSDKVYDRLHKILRERQKIMLYQHFTD
jgi:hypothetical protein